MKKNNEKGNLITRIGIVFDVYEDGVGIGTLDLEGIDNDLENKKFEIMALKKQIRELKRKYKEPISKSEELDEMDFENEFELPTEIKELADNLFEAIFKNIEK